MLPKQNQHNKFFILLIVIVAFSFNAYPQTNTPDPNYRLLKGNDFVQSKNYYLLTLFQGLAEVKKLLTNDTGLARIAQTRAGSLESSLKICERNGLCYLESMKFSATEIQAVSERLIALYQPGNALGKLVQNHLIPSGNYILYQNLSATEMLVKAWEQDANGINFCIGVYAGGNKPNYPLIDSISFNTKDPHNSNTYLFSYVGLLYNTASLVALENKANASFFYSSLTCAVRFLEMNEREQAADFEPMDNGENKLAADRIKTIQWQNYKYTVILVPGAGPDEPAVALSAEAMIRCRLAVIQYQNKLAPFIVVSGGKVHPYKTKFCEATEMKKYLMERLHVPENAILIDPHARHTTTNMRNTARMIYRYGMPFNKAGVTCTTRGQSSMIGNTLIARCLKELKEVPYKNGERLSETLIEFFPLKEALQINPEEPMDP